MGESDLVAVGNQVTLPAAAVVPTDQRTSTGPSTGEPTLTMTRHRADLQERTETVEDRQEGQIQEVKGQTELMETEEVITDTETRSSVQEAGSDRKNLVLTSCSPKQDLKDKQSLCNIKADFMVLASSEPAVWNRAVLVLISRIGPNTTEPDFSVYRNTNVCC